MRRRVTIRLAILAALALAAILYLAPSYVGELPEWWPSFLPKDRINLGLDLQGGSHLILEVKVDKALENRVERIKEDLRRTLAEKGIADAALERTKDNQIQIKVPAAAGEGLRDLVKIEFPNLVQVNSHTVAGSLELWLSLQKEELRSLREETVDQSLETIRNRIDQFGVSEPIIQRRGQQDILVQLPGIQDPQRAKEIIGKTALLEFKLVDETHNVDEAARGNPPPGTEILYGYAVRGDGRLGADKVPYLLEARTLMTGDYIADARVRPGSGLDGPYV
ncbi:MAG: protein translocase subunit SecD, partial [Candidatus Binatia bacterium]